MEPKEFLGAMELNNRLAVRWNGGKPEDVKWLAMAGTEVVVAGEATAEFLAAAGKAGMVVVKPEEVSGLVAAGLYPGIRRGPSQRGQDVEVASASREPWVDSNGYLVAYEKAVRGGEVVLGYEANEKAGVKPDVETVVDVPELALIEARVMGGNWVVDLPARHRERLLAGEAKQVAAWKKLGQTAGWLKKNAALLGRGVLPMVTAVVEPGGMSKELANLLFRRGASPRVVGVGGSLEGALVVVAAGVKAVPEGVWAFARKGGMVVVDVPVEGAVVKEEVDRRYVKMGAGTVVSYKRRIVDPSEFALDVIDLVGQKKRAARLWNARAAVAVGMEKGVLAVVNYSGPAREEVQAQMQGHYGRAVLLQPGAADKELKVARRGSCSEVFLPELERLGVVRFTA